MNLRDLRYLAALAEHKHFGRAATACHVTQPTLSQQIKKLESYLGVALLERDSHRVMLTPVGQEIAARARRVVHEADSLVQLARAATDPLQGDFRLGAFPTLAPYYLPRVLPALRKRFNRLRLFLIEDKTPQLLQQLQRGEIDAALLALPVTEEALDVISLFTEPFLLVVPKAHALARHKQVHQDDLAGQSLLLLEEGHCLREQALAVCARAGAGETAEFRASSLETLREMVAGGIGITLLPAMARRADDRGLRYLPFSDAPTREIGLVFRRSSTRRATMSALAQTLRRLAPDGST